MTKEEMDVLKVYETLTEDEKYIVARLIQALLEVRKDKI